MPDRVIASAIIDRLLHYSVTINISGESFRLRQHREHGTFPGDILGREAGDAGSVAFRPAKLQQNKQALTVPGGYLVLPALEGDQKLPVYLAAHLNIEGLGEGERNSKSRRPCGFFTYRG